MLFWGNVGWFHWSRVSTWCDETVGNYTTPRKELLMADDETWIPCNPLGACRPYTHTITQHDICYVQRPQQSLFQNHFRETKPNSKTAHTPTKTRPPNSQPNQQSQKTSLGPKQSNNQAPNKFAGSQVYLLNPNPPQKKNGWLKPNPPTSSAPFHPFFSPRNKRRSDSVDSMQSSSSKSSKAKEPPSAAVEERPRRPKLWSGVFGGAQAAEVERCGGFWRFLEAKLGG